MTLIFRHVYNTENSKRNTITPHRRQAVKPLSIIILIIILTGCVHVRPWTPAEKVALGASWLAAGADYYTSERAFDDPGNHECNPIPGKHPTDTELAIYMLTSQITATVLANCIPKWRSWLLGGKTTINGACAWHNYNLVK